MIAVVPMTCTICAGTVWCFPDTTDPVCSHHSDLAIGQVTVEGDLTPGGQAIIEQLQPEALPACPGCGCKPWWSEEWNCWASVHPGGCGWSYDGETWTQGPDDQYEDLDDDP
jgi:hypothetical protein